LASAQSSTIFLAFAPAAAAAATSAMLESNVRPQHGHRFEELMDSLA